MVLQINPLQSSINPSLVLRIHNHSLLPRNAMEALNVAKLTPISLLSQRNIKPRQTLSLLRPPSLKTSDVGLVLFSSLLGSGSAQALTYEEALQQTVGTPTSPVVDFGEIIGGAVDFGSENAALIAGVAAIVAVPVILSRVFSGKPRNWGVESARNAYARLGDDVRAELLDIRAPAELRLVGAPDIRGLRKTPVAVEYRGGDKPGFLRKLALKFKEPESTTLLILDKFDENSELVAELVTLNGFKAAYAIKDGAEGPQGWMNSGLPWILPKKTLNFDFSWLIDAFGEGFNPLPIAVTIAAASGLGYLVYTKVETILQLIGLAALVQLILTNLSSEDRKQTQQQVSEFLNNYIAPGDIVEDVKQIGKALLPFPTTGRALPSLGDTMGKAEADSDPQAVEAALATSPKINSVLGPRPLSPYPFYLDLKPPTSPTPSQP
ncbi:hypothetical protein NMG60_11022753 [Bertholletia excelsa]